MTLEAKTKRTRMTQQIRNAIKDILTAETTDPWLQRHPVTDKQLVEMLGDDSIDCDLATVVATREELGFESRSTRKSVRQSKPQGVAWRES